MGQFSEDWFCKTSFWGEGEKKSFMVICYFGHISALYRKLVSSLVIPIKIKDATSC